MPTFLEQPTNKNINLYETVSFKCTAQGFGVLKIAWKRVKYDMPTTEKPIEKKLLNKFTSTLKFTKTAGYYSGQYYCVAENEVGNLPSRTANLHVQGNNNVIIHYIFVMLSYHAAKLKAAIRI